MTDDDEDGDGGRTFPRHRVTPDRTTVLTAEQAAAAAARFRLLAQRIRANLPAREGGG
jgi:hypothetical protein